MPDKATLKRAAADKRAGKSSSTQAGEFVKEEIDHVREGKHGVKSAKQAIAIGLSKARRAGVALKQPKAGTTSEATRKKAAKDTAAGQQKTPAVKHSAAKKASKTTVARRPGSESTAKRSRVAEAVLKRESGQGASKEALSKQTKAAAARRPAASRSAAAKKAAETKGAAGRSAAAKKAAHTRATRAHH
ncbi:DUF6496 domain-containing protein [Paraburkholderia sp. 22B1P]|uniref:DUF6496 domain-containing protein n=1 Tax=Paraburkholderia sp. 22B1P TaxID=3080498 RepID=UPI0030874263|nr:DUF6496 domain-containing protein [Paraburkholderia sp. 22B1P]